MRTCESSCAITPSSSSSFMSSIKPCVTATDAWLGLRPVANAFGAGLRNHVQLRHRQIGLGRQALHHRVEPRRLLAADRHARRWTPAQFCPRRNRRRRSSGPRRPARSSCRCVRRRLWPTNSSSSVKAVSRNVVLRVFINLALPSAGLRAIRRRLPSPFLVRKLHFVRFSHPHPRRTVSPGCTSPSRIFSASGS